MPRLLVLWRLSDPLLAVPLLAGATLVVLFSRDLPWRGEWAWTFDWAAGTTVLTGPLTAGSAAFVASRWRSATADLSLRTARRSLAAWFAPGLGPLMSATAVYATGIAVAIGVSAPLHPSDPVSPAVLALGLLKLVASVAVGWTLGMRLPAAVAAVSAVALGYILVVVASTDGLLQFWRVGGSTGPMSGEVIDYRYLAGAAALFLTVGMAIGSQTMLQRSSTRRLGLRALGCATVALLIGVSLSVTSTGNIYHVSTKPHYICRGDQVIVCLLAGNTRYLDSWSQSFTAATTSLKPVGLKFPHRYEQPTPGGRRSPTVGEMFFDPQRVNTEPPAREYVVESLSTPATCPDLASDEVPPAALAARSWLGVWMWSWLWPTDSPGLDSRVIDWERQTSLAQQETWAATAFAALSRCALSELAAPVAT